MKNPNLLRIDLSTFVTESAFKRKKEEEYTFLTENNYNLFRSYEAKTRIPRSMYFSKKLLGCEPEELFLLMHSDTRIALAFELTYGLSLAITCKKQVYEYMLNALGTDNNMSLKVLEAVWKAPKGT